MKRLGRLLSINGHEVRNGLMKAFIKFSVKEALLIRVEWIKFTTLVSYKISTRIDRLTLAQAKLVSWWTIYGPPRPL